MEDKTISLTPNNETTNKNPNLENFTINTTCNKYSINTDEAKNDGIIIKVNVDNDSNPYFLTNNKTDNKTNKLSINQGINQSDNNSAIKLSTTSQSSNQSNSQSNNQNQMGYSFLPNASDVKISILGKLEQDLFTIDENKARSADIVVKTKIEDYLNTISVNNVYLNDLNTYEYVNDPYIESIKDKLNKLQDQATHTCLKSENNENLIINKQTSLSSLKSEEVLIKEKAITEEFLKKASVMKAMKEFAKTFNEQVDKMKKILRKYQEAVKELMGAEIIEKKGLKDEFKSYDLASLNNRYEYVFNDQKNKTNPIYNIKHMLSRDDFENIANFPTINAGDTPQEEAEIS